MQYSTGTVSYQYVTMLMIYRRELDRSQPKPAIQKRIVDLEVKEQVARPAYSMDD
jgi:hypothetical protein